MQAIKTLADVKTYLLKNDAQFFNRISGIESSFFVYPSLNKHSREFVRIERQYNGSAYNVIIEPQQRAIDEMTGLSLDYWVFRGNFARVTIRPKLTTIQNFLDWLSTQKIGATIEADQ